MHDLTVNYSRNQEENWLINMNEWALARGYDPIESFSHGDEEVANPYRHSGFAGGEYYTKDINPILTYGMDYLTSGFYALRCGHSFTEPTIEFPDLEDKWEVVNKDAELMRYLQSLTLTALNHSLHSIFGEKCPELAKKVHFHEKEKLVSMVKQSPCSNMKVQSFEVTGMSEVEVKAEIVRNIRILAPTIGDTIIIEQDED